MTDGWYNYLPWGEEVLNRAMETESGKHNIGEWLNQVLLKRSKPALHPPASSAVKDPHDINTLGGCLTYFYSTTLLQELEDSLERVRKHKKRKEHEEFTKEIDKKLQKLSYEYHPDKVSNRGGSVDEMATAQKLQTALNSTRTVLRILHKEFLEDLDIDHKYGFYAKLEISSLGNEEQIKKEISDVLYKTALLSEIKQVDIIAQIRMFLSESQVSLNKYVEKNEAEFKRYRNYALYHLKKCIEGYEKLFTEFKTIDEECKSENLVNIAIVINEMADKSSKELDILKKLEGVAKYSLERHFRIFSSSEHMDEYFVLPFVYYVNVLLICTLIFEEKRSSVPYLHTWCSGSHYVPLLEMTGVELMLNAVYDLALKLNEECQTEVKGVLKNSSSLKNNFKDVINNFLLNLKEKLENRFRVENYEEGGNKKYLLEHYAILMNKAANIDDTILKIFKDMPKGTDVKETTNENWENFKKDTNTIDKKLEESLKQSNLLQEKVSKIIYKNHQQSAEKDEICVTEIDELDEEIAESLKQSKLLQDQVSKILQRKDGEIEEESGTDFVRSNELKKEFAESFEKSYLLQEQVSTMFKSNDQGNEVEGEIGMGISNEYREEIVECIEQD